MKLASHGQATTTTQWASLNDVFAAGDTEVWYQNRASFGDFNLTDRFPDKNDLGATHVLLGKVAPCPNGAYCPDDLDELWQKLQGEFWSPQGEANTLVRSLGVHTSMSVGDCFKLPNGEVYMVDMAGFKLL